MKQEGVFLWDIHILDGSINHGFVGYLMGVNWYMWIYKKGWNPQNLLWF